MRCETRWLLLVTWALIVAMACRPAAGQTAAPADAARDLAGMSPAEKKELQGKQERFYRLDPQTQDQLRQLHDELMRDPASARLPAVLTRYLLFLLVVLQHGKDEQMRKLALDVIREQNREIAEMNAWLRLQSE